MVGTYNAEPMTPMTTYDIPALHLPTPANPHLEALPYHSSFLFGSLLFVLELTAS